MTPSIDNSVIKEDLSDTDEVFEEALEELSDDFENIISNETLDIASEEIGENEQSRAQALAEVTCWLQSQPHLRHSRSDPSFLLRFLRTNKYKIEKTCAMIERYLKMRMDHPKWFQNLDIEVNVFANSVAYFPNCALLHVPGPAGAGAHHDWLHLRAAGEGPGGAPRGVERGQGPGPREAQHQPRAQGPHRDLRGERDKNFNLGSNRLC